MDQPALLDDPLAQVPRSLIDWPDQLRRHAPWLRTVIRGRLGNWNDVDDVLQELSARVVTASRKPPEVDQIAPWLYRITIRLCLTRRRAAGRQKNFLQRWMTAMQPAGRHQSDLLDRIADAELASNLQAAIDQLPQIERDVFLLKHVHYWTYQQIAGHLGCTVYTIEHRLLKARRLLRSSLAAAGMAGGDS
jgi:RNA polymerase sigma factor (sigma-70 family)